MALLSHLIFQRDVFWKLLVQSTFLLKQKSLNVTSTSTSTGTSTVDELQILHATLTSLLQNGCCELRKSTSSTSANLSNFWPPRNYSAGTLKVKIITQKKFVTYIDWDEPLPISIQNLWLEHQSETKYLNDNKIPSSRYYQGEGDGGIL